MNPKILNREAREVRLRNAAACLGWQNHGLYRVSRKVRAFYRGESAVLPKPKHHLERALDPKRNGADAIIDEFAEALKLYLPDEAPRQPLRVAYKSTLKLIECGIEAVHRHCCLNKLETLLADMRSYFTHPKPDTTPEEHCYWVDHFRKLWKQGCYAISDAFYNFTTEAINRREEVARGVAAPTLARKKTTSKSKDWNQRMAADLLGISTRQLRKYEKNPPDAEYPGWWDALAFKLWVNRRNDRDEMNRRLAASLGYKEGYSEAFKRKV